MRIGIIGAGGVGGYYGALLARAGHAVTFFARGEHLAVIRRQGLTIEDHDSRYVVHAEATDDIGALDGTELALLAVKSYSLPSVSAVVASLGRAGAIVLPLLNGVDAATRLEAAGVPGTQLVGGSTFVSASRPRPGVITRHSTNERIVVGELDGRMTSRIEAIATALRSMQVEVVATPAIIVELWQKYAFICSISAACGMARASLGVVRDQPLGHRLLERAVAEIAAVARERGVAIPADQEAKTMAFIDSLPGGLTPSFLLDVLRGGPTELDIMSRAVAAFGAECRISTPIHDTAAAVLPD